MGTKLFQAEERSAGRRPANCIRSPPSGKSARNDSSTLHRRSSPRLNKPTGPSTTPLPLRSSRHFRSSDVNSARDRVALARSKSPTVESLPAKKIVMENVVILKRQTVVKNHQSEDSCAPSSPSVKPVRDSSPGCSSPVQIHPESDDLPKDIPIVNREPHLYAGSGFVTSPAPSSLPLPKSFFEKKDVSSSVERATESLRFMLRLDVA